MKLVRSFGRFWYDFLIGDDWKIACSVIVALVLTGCLMRMDVVGDGVVTVVGALLVAAAFTVSLLIDVRGTGGRS